jgi:hypothetical protein
MRREAMKVTTNLPLGRRTNGHRSEQDAIPEDEAYWRTYLGEYLDENGVQTLLGLDEPRRLEDLVARHEILAVPTARGMAFPKFQFLGGEVNQTISRVVKIFSSVVASPYTTASWLRGARFDDKSVAEWIESGENPDIVLKAAEESAARLAA